MNALLKDGGMSDIDAEKAISQILKLGDLVTPMVIRTASSMRLADQFEEECPETVTSLSEKLSVDESALQRLLIALTEINILSTVDFEKYSLTQIGKVLRSDHPFSMRDAYTIALTDVNAWFELANCVRTGQAGFEHFYKESHRDYRARVLEEDKRMDRAHQAATRLDLVMLIRAYPWDEIDTIVDVGGGTGTFLGGVLQRFPNIQGTLFDLPRMVANAPAVLAEYGVEDRCIIVPGDFFKEIPKNADVYVLKAVLGGWNDESSIQILNVIRNAMRKDSRLLIIEPVMGIGEPFARSNVVQLHSMVLYGGSYRNIEDYHQLAKKSGYVIERIVPRSTLPILELSLSDEYH